MAKNINYVSHKKSKVKVNGKPQLPSADSLVEGEIAINFAENVETLSIKNESGAVVTFSSDNYYSEQKLGSAFTGANSAVTVTDEFGLYVKKTDVDQVINETTSASTSAVSTSAVYDFVTSHTPSITVDQVLDDTTSASTNPVATKAVYSAITDNELVWSMAFLAMSGNVSSHTVNTNIHMTPTEKTNIDALASNIGTLSAITATSTAINSLTGSVGTMAFQNTSSYSSATEVNTALSNKANTSDIANFFDDAKYEDSGTTKVINFYHGNTIKATIDATDFIVDGMVDDVRIENGNLVIDFNTASGKQDISIPLTDIFDPSNYYDKDDIDDLVGSGFTSSSITDVIIENEEIVSNALIDLDERKLDASAYTPTDLSNYYTKSEIQNALTAKTDTATTTALNNVVTAHTANTTVHITAAERTSWNAVTAKTDNSAFTAHTASTVHMNNTEKTNLDSLATNIAAISGITSAKVGNWDTAYTNNHTHSNKTYLDSITGSVGTMAYQATSSYSSATEVNTALASKVNTADIVTAITPSNSGSTNPIATKVVAENELIVSNALTDLDERKLDASAYTPTDLSNYYTKSETSGKTEIANALSGKVDATEYATFSASTNDSIDDLSGQSQTIAAALVNLNTNKLDITAYTPTTLLEEITYSALKSKRDSGQLVQGQWYRITDYVTTTTQNNTQSAGHVFDIIVRADKVNSLNENAYATKHAGDTYFTNAGAKLEAWELKYCLDNDADRFYWADTTSGKGVIYYMKDEWNNECPYDFKNIQFKRYKIAASTKCPDLIDLYAIDGATDVTVDTATTYWSYTFCMYDLNEDAPCDVSTFQDKYWSDESIFYKTYNNSIKPHFDSNYDVEPATYQIALNDTVFITDTDICSIEEDYGEFYGFYSNTFGNDCGGNTFGNECYNNTFGNYFRYNTFGNSCYQNTFGNYFQYNTFGNSCYYNTFGNSCYQNTFGNNCGGNTFGNDCNYNTFGNYFQYNTFGNGCYNITFPKDYCRYNIVENGNQYITLTSSATTSSSNVLRNITIAQGVNNTSTLKTISHNTVNDSFQTIYKPTNSVEKSI